MNTKISNLDSPPQPEGELVLQAVTMPKDTNASGDIFGGWLLSQMDMAGGIAAAKVAKGRIATVAIEQMSFLLPVEVGTVVACYTQVKAIGNSSIHILIQAWKSNMQGKQKAADGLFIYVAIDNSGNTKTVPK